MTAPALSIVTPTKGSPAAVADLLDSLDAAIARLPSDVSAEVIIVDDSEPGDARAITERCARSGAAYHRGPPRVGSKRNLGTSIAAAPIVDYIDSDCLATPDLLLRHLRGHQELRAPSGRPVGAVAGPTQVPGAESEHAWRVVSPSVVVNSCWLWPARFAEVWWAATANLSVSKPAFEAIGGFDDHTVTLVGSEDVDFGVRLSAAGYAIVCDPLASVTHRTDGMVSLRQFGRKMFRYGRACTYNCTRQPDHARWSANPVTIAGIGTAAGLAALATPARRRVGYALLASTAIGTTARFATTVVRSARSNHTSLADAAALVAVDWSFDVGIAAQAVRCGQPGLALRRFDYFPLHRFHPYQEAAE